MGRQVFTAGEILTAASMNDLGDATVMVFDDATARATAIPTPSEGMVTYLKDEDEVTVFDGSAFKAVGPGQILQVVSTTKTDAFTQSLTATSFSANVTGLEATITPSTTASKILVSVTVTGTSSDFVSLTYRVMRDSTAISVGDAASNRTRVTGVSQGPGALTDRTASASLVFLDSPSSTSAIVYGVQVFNPISGTATVFVNRNQSDADTATNFRSPSSITLMEVAG